jgi:hypothetical protein
MTPKAVVVRGCDHIGSLNWQVQLIKVNRIKSYDKKLFPMKILVLELLVIAGVTFVLAGNYELI